MRLRWQKNMFHFANSFCFSWLAESSSSLSYVRSLASCFFGSNPDSNRALSSFHSFIPSFIIWEHIHSCYWLCNVNVRLMLMACLCNNIKFQLHIIHYHCSNWDPSRVVAVVFCFLLHNSSAMYFFSDRCSYSSVLAMLMTTYIYFLLWLASY